MLVLSRKQTEKVFINDSVVVTVLGIRGNTVRLGIEAPMEIPVHRGEVRQSMRNPDVPGSVG